MIRPWRYLCWTHTEKRLFWKALYWLCRAKFSISKRKMGDLNRLLKNQPTQAKALFNDIKYARPTQLAVHRAKRVLPFHCQCLVEAIAVQTLCRQNHLPTTLHLGVQVNDNERLAHAWVCLGEQVISGQTDQKFTSVQEFS